MEYFEFICICNYICIYICIEHVFVIIVVFILVFVFLFVGRHMGAAPNYILSTLLWAPGALQVLLPITLYIIGVILSHLASKLNCHYPCILCTTILIEGKTH